MWCSARGNRAVGVPGSPGQHNPGNQRARPWCHAIPDSGFRRAAGLDTCARPRVHDRDGACQTPSTLLVLNAAQIRAFWAYDLSFGFAFMQRIAQVLTSRLFATRLLLLDVYRE